ncbi:MAG TPA: UvrB/UvrC motif-containing protein [Synergistaceae bacterium]|nr:UvrB/UvrC motif-containing protein [Synergistaceae bacterium]HPJ24758.1 UvrB/UvrC motif-containing protein [Synergistaceae bacterium]HPQ37479.1 UvrB/UvrC motif-containing protein [Synergistaceae bacterium]
MKCSYCGKREAELHIRAVVDGKVQEFHFCRECARKLREGFLLPGLASSVPINELAQAVGSFLDGFTSEEEKENLPRHGKKPSREETPLFLHGRCPQCGCDEEWFAMTKFLGCPSCYNAFREDILEYLKKEQKGDLHVGSTPSWYYDEEEENPSVEIRKLEEDLRRLVREERYEEAAELRDRIRSLSSLTENTPHE